MCGLAGIFSTTHSESEFHLRAGDMGATLRHRGPDDEGAWIDSESGIALSFRRLAVLDLSPAGHQPMLSGSGRWVLVMNGEIYNHQELRRTLEGKGARFRGTSDTEVLLQAIETWGLRRALESSVGMFALAVWDRQLRQLSLARDRLGIKPLLMGRARGTLLFASEMRALLAHPWLEKRVSPGAMAAYLRYLAVPEPATILEGVTKVPPGTFLTFAEPTATPNPEPFWDAAGAMERGGKAVTAEELRSGLEESVRTHLRSDVPLGALLSGGVDSSLLVALARQHASDLRTYTVAFDDPRHDESAHAAAVARHLDTQHTTIDLRTSDLLDCLPQLGDFLDEPFANPSILPAWLVAREARRQVTVALAGDGGDEVFAGYTRLIHGPRLLRRMARLPRPMRLSLAALIEHTPPAWWEWSARAANLVLPPDSRSRLADEKMAKLANALRYETPGARYRTLLSAGWSDPQRLMINPEGARSSDPVFADLSRFDRILPELDDLLRIEQRHYLTYDLLHKVDRATMYAGLEARVPFLDHKVVELAWRLPQEELVANGTGKRVLRGLLHRQVPHELVDRPKTGFTVPLASWLQGPMAGMVSDRLDPGVLTSLGLDPTEPLAAWARLRNGSGSGALRIWSILMLVEWANRWLDAPRAGAWDRPVDSSSDTRFAARSNTLR